ncbi:MAG: hypothetical protein P8Q36_09475 [Alphaproteobacteria bacterium]|jgi:glutamine kinase|nr:hypothetical protein [Rhodospirillaceae bacterium]MBT7612371.1 hypothetical protein [Rhodospirillaceae bacterium]MBT7648825.1 hypothetical protein [Rhodospirillaceae bacterium]MDG2481080.1 hypothetical protein [Alphaproteobacteria bacterium]
MNAATMEFGTKGETLARLAPLVPSADFCEQILFTVSAWRQDQGPWLSDILNAFGDGLLVVRSSGLSEDTQVSSMASVFDSVISIEPSRESISKAVKTVIASYGTGPGGNQILVQPMVRDVAISGVVVTRELSIVGCRS